MTPSGASCVEQPVLHTNWLLPHRPVAPARARPAVVRAGAVGLGAAAVAVLTVIAVVVAPWGDGGNARAAAARAAADANDAAVDAGAPPLTPLQQDTQAATLATERFRLASAIDLVWPQKTSVLPFSKTPTIRQ